MKKRLLLFGTLSLPLAGMAQQLSPAVLASGGGTARTSTMVLDWTLGELVVETVTTPDRLYTQGFHQPMLQVVELDNQASLAGGDAAFTFTVAPNPVASYLTVGITAPEDASFQLRLTDLNGRQYDLPAVPTTVRSTQIDMTQFSAGMYLLHISKADGQLLKSYKVFKAQ